MRKILSYLMLVFLLSCTTDQLPESSEPITGNNEVQRIIYLIGDGMGVNHIELLKLEQNRTSLIFDEADGKGKISTFSANNKITDSAAAGTALACGQKTNNGMVGMLPDGTSLTSILKLYKESDWKTGIIVTCNLTHATPASFYANARSRDYDNIITTQLINSEIDVLVGGGINNENNPVFLDSVRNVLIQQDYLILNNPEELKGLLNKKIALFMADKGFLPTIIKGRSPELMPSVTDNVLKNFGDNPFFLMIEGSQIDTQSHANNITGVIGEMSDFEKVASRCFEYADTHPGTLIIVTADHETGGLTLYDEKSDKRLPVSGVPFSFSTDYHTDAMVSVYAYGSGAEMFNGEYDNTLLFDKLKSMLPEKDNLQSNKREIIQSRQMVN